MKNLKDYYDPNFKVILRADVSWVWSKILAEDIQEIEMTHEDFVVFCSLFINQLPHDWDRKTFMGVTIHKESYGDSLQNKKR